jgi:hypothetical protein
MTLSQRHFLDHDGVKHLPVFHSIMSAWFSLDILSLIGLFTGSFKFHFLIVIVIQSPEGQWSCPLENNKGSKDIFVEYLGVVNTN